ncbi:MAG TPA: tetratricopeptide repeat protein [Trueperaceae bacterium]
MWLPRVAQAVTDSDRPVALVGGEPFGVPFLIDALGKQAPLVWLELGPSASNDPVAQGNALARAVNRMLPSPLLSLALPYKSQLAALARFRSDLQPLRFAVTTNRLDLPFLGDLLDLHGNGYSVLLDVRERVAADEQVLSRCYVVGPEQLMVTREEAGGMLPAALDQAAVEALWRRSRGRFTELSSMANEAVNLPRLNVPSPEGPVLPQGREELVDPRLAVYAYVREGDPISALELAVLRAPELVDDLLRTAGPRFQSEGLLERLHLLLSALPESHSRGERVLEWRLVAGVATNDLQGVGEDVDAYLSAHSAPTLRARRAGTIRHDKGFAMAEQAAQARRTPVTLWQYGRLHPNDETAVDVLRESVRLAEEQGSAYDVARNAYSLASRLLHMGEYTRAASWARWALDVVDREQLQDGNRRLQIVNQLAMARIMTGDLLGLRHLLEDAQALVEGSLPHLATYFRSTLAQLELAEGRPTEAYELLRATYHASPRKYRGRYGYQLARALLELDRTDEAAEVASDVWEVSSAGGGFERTLAALARGMVGAVTGTQTAADDLLEAMLDTDLIAEQRMTAALYYLLATGGAAHNVPRELVPLLASLHPVGRAVLSGPAGPFERVWSTLSSPRAPLTLKFLGGFEGRYEGEEVQLPPRLAEVALAIALNPEGTTRDELNDFLAPVGHAPFTSGGMRSIVTRLRQVLPVSDAPYRFTVRYEADVVQLRELIGASRIREAVSLMKGPLLPQSEAPGVEEHRLELEEHLRQAVLMAGDPDALYDLAERLTDDLEFWQAAAAALSNGDPRLALARARVKRLEEAYGLS